VKYGVPPELADPITGLDDFHEVTVSRTESDINWLAAGVIPFEAVSMIVKGDPSALGGVPLNLPVALLKTAQSGRPLAVSVTGGDPVAETVNSLVCPI